MLTFSKNWPKSKKSTFRTARRLAVGGDPVIALKLVNSYLKQEKKNDVDLLILKSNILQMIGRFAQSARISRHILQIVPYNTLALIDLGDYYKALSKPNYRKALQLYDRALRLINRGRFHYDKEEEYLDACRGKIDVLLALKRPTAALRCIIDGLQKYSRNLTLRKMLQNVQEQ